MTAVEVDVVYHTLIAVGVDVVHHTLIAVGVDVVYHTLIAAARTLSAACLDVCLAAMADTRESNAVFIYCIVYLKFICIRISLALISLTLYSSH